MAIPLLAAGLGAAGALGGGYLAGRNQAKETKTQKTQRKLMDQLIGSLEGNGPYSWLFETNYEDFQKAFVDPAKSKFTNQIAPQIQQQYIAAGQQRGTGLDDQLLRAGVDLDQLLNQQYMEFINQGKNRAQSTIGQILGGGAGGTQNMSSGQALGNAAAGYLASEGFQNAVGDVFGNNYKPEQPQRKGFEANAAYAAQAR